MSVTAKAVWYIESHLSDDVSLDAVARAVGVSRFHLSRAFGVTVGSALAQYVRARRLTLAACALAQGAPDILAVALESGYSSHEAFTRAFRQQFGVPPEQVRQQGHLRGVATMEPARFHGTTAATIPAPRTVQSEELLIFGLSDRHEGTNAGIPAQWNRFAPHLGHIDHQVGAETFGVICNTDEAATMEYITGVRVSEFPREPREFARLRIPPLTYAVFEHRDHVTAIPDTWKAIWNHALSAAGLDAADGPAMERYGPSFDPRTGLGGLEIWVPVRS